MTDAEEPKSNRLLAALAGADWQRWHPHLECTDLQPGQVLYAPGRPPRHAYFPTSAVVSLLCTVESGASTEIAVVGNEGVVGVSLFLGAETATSRGLVLIAGQGFRIGARTIKDEFNRSDSVRHVVLRYIQALATQIAQTAVCNRHHSIEQQLCGFLLHSLDRMRSTEIVVTQELIASILGVRRESVTEAAGRLQAAGLIHYARGHITVLNRVGLERRSCECHAAVKKEYDRLLPREPAARPIGADRCESPAWDPTGPCRTLQQQDVAATCET
jgi:CRP-like cAMP-binding protein